MDFMAYWDCLPAVGEPLRELVTQAAKCTVPEGGGPFCLQPVGGAETNSGDPTLIHNSQVSHTLWGVFNIAKQQRIL